MTQRDVEHRIQHDWHTIWSTTCNGIIFTHLTRTSIAIIHFNIELIKFEKRRCIYITCFIFEWVQLKVPTAVVECTCFTVCCCGASWQLCLFHHFFNHRETSLIDWPVIYLHIREWYYIFCILFVFLLWIFLYDHIMIHFIDFSF